MRLPEFLTLEMPVAKKARPWMACALAAVLGWLGVGGPYLGLALTPLVIGLWACARDRREAFGVMVCYYLAAARGLVVGAAVFFPDPDGARSWVTGLGMWLAPSVLLAGCWAVCWGRKWLSLRAIVALVAVSVPPIGIVGWANPISSAGVLTPGSGWFGLGFTIALCLCLSERRLRFLAVMLTLMLLARAAIRGDQPQANPEGWRGINTQLGSGRQPGQEYEAMRSLQALVKRASLDAAPGTVFVLPELVAGDWSANEIWWREVSLELERKGQTALIGASVPGGSGKEVNVLVSLGQRHDVTVFDRMPVPGSMWRPWSGDGFEAFMAAPGVTSVGAKRVGHVICYEQLLIWPMLATLAAGPDLLIAPANGWWASGTSVPRIQEQAVGAWADLFGLPVVRAWNR